MRLKVSDVVSAALERDGTSDVLVVFHRQADLGGARRITGKRNKALFAYTELSAVAAREQTGALRLLSGHTHAVNSLLIVNAIAVERAKADLVRQLASLEEVAWIAPDPWVRFPDPVRESAPASLRTGVEWGVDRIQAPAVWSLGYTGQGITVGGADTGYDWAHPALQRQYRGWDSLSQTASHDYHWYDGVYNASPLNTDTLNPCGFRSPLPCDDGSHGTHTAGTMVGDDGQGNQIGVAPGARWVGCRNMERGWGRPSTYLNCFEWFLAPTDVDGGQPDPDKAPHVINNSWYCNEVEGCVDQGVNDLLRMAIANLKASGVFVVVSAGNFGPSCASTNYPPGYFEESFSIGAIRANDTIAAYSSRGPVTVDSSFRIKPNVVAPGSNVRSSVTGGGYAAFSGTSMAGPHVAGLVALVLSAAPSLEGEVELLEHIIEQTSTPQYGLVDCGDMGGTERPNNTYGYGSINALEAVQRANQIVAQKSPNIGAGLRLYPNPADLSTALAAEGIYGPVQIVLFNTAGQQVQAHRIVADGTLRITLSLIGFPPGAYLCRVQSQGKTRSTILIKR